MTPPPGAGNPNEVPAGRSAADAPIVEPDAHADDSTHSVAATGAPSAAVAPPDPAPGVRDGYLALLLHPPARLPWLAAFMARIVLGMTVVSIVLLARRTGNGYGLAGALAATNSIGVAIATPIWGRLVDRRGPVRLLQSLGVVHASALVALAVAATQGAPSVVLFTAALAVGLSFPPVSAVARVAWRRVYGPRLRDRAFALDSVTVELGFVVGPVVAAALVDGVAAWSGVVVAGGMMLVGCVLFSRSGVARATRGGVAVIRGGAVRVPAVRALMVVCILIAVCFGSMDIVAPAVAEAAGRTDLTGVILGAFALGSGVGGFVYGARRWPLSRVGRLQLMAVVLTATFCLLTLVTTRPALFIVVAVVAGLVISPMLITLFALVDDLAPESVVTEAISWLNTAFTLGAALGAGLAGRLVDLHGMRMGVLGGAAGLVGAVVAVAVVRPRITREERTIGVG